MQSKSYIFITLKEKNQWLQQISLINLKKIAFSNDNWKKRCTFAPRIHIYNKKVRWLCQKQNTREKKELTSSRKYCHPKRMP